MQDGEDFHRLAREYSKDETTRHAGGYAGMVTRSMLTPETEAHVFSARPGDVIGPYVFGENQQLMLVEEVRRAENAEQVREAIADRLFQQWAVSLFQNGICITG